MPNREEILKHKYQTSIGLPFAQVLSDCEIQQVLDDQNIRYRQVLYTPIVVLWTWISQVVDQGQKSEACAQTHHDLASNLWRDYSMLRYRWVQQSQKTITLCSSPSTPGAHGQRIA